jgi:hypothetical protein
MSPVGRNAVTARGGASREGDRPRASVLAVDTVGEESETVGDLGVNVSDCAGTDVGAEPERVEGVRGS